MPPELNIIDALAEALAPVLAAKAQKTATGTPTTTYAFGPGGLFSTAGIEQDVIATVVQPRGLLSVLPAFGTQHMEPIFQYITGFRDDTGEDPATVCADCKTAGVKKGCRTIANFGRYCRETRELSIERVSQLQNRAYPAPGQLRLVNPVFGGNQMTPGITRQNPFAGEVQQALLEVGVSFERLLSKQLWIGNPANDNVGGGYEEFPGLESLVVTGHVDAVTNTACPSLDSDVKDFNYQDVCTGNAPGIVETLSYMFRYVRHNALTMGFDPVEWAFVMREELFYELTSCWPCSYLSFRCQTNNADVDGMVMANESIRMRDDMRNGRYLLVDGIRVPVLLDDGIPEDTATNNANLAPGEFASDIYLLPLRVRGSFTSLYLEYFDFRTAQGQIDLAKMGEIYQVTDNGKFLWTKSWVEGCFLMKAVIRPRVLLLTPHLAGRLQNVKYSPLQHTRSPFPDDGYFVNGGVTDTTLEVPQYYTQWDRD